MAAVLERSFIEICGFERETVHRLREVTVNLGNVFTGGGALLTGQTRLFYRTFVPPQSARGAERHHMLTASIG